MRTFSAALALLTQIEIVVNESDTCPVDVYQVTAGEPAAPSSACTVISVWASQLFNAFNSLNHEDSPCVIVRGVQLQYRIDTCYGENDDGTDRSPVDQLIVARCLYGLADAVWCGLNGRLDLITGARCADITVDPMSFTGFQGGIVSASSGIRFQSDCPTPEGS